MGITNSGIIATPLEVPSSVVWLDCADTNLLAPYTSGGLVSQIRDKSGRGNHAIQATDADKATTGSTINGKNALSFNGSSSFYSIADNPSVSPTTGMTLFAVFRIASSTSSTKSVVSKDRTGVSNPPYRISYIQNTPIIQFAMANPASSSTVVQIQGALNTPYIFAANYDGTNANLTLNQLTTSPSAHAIILDSTGPLLIGRQTLDDTRFSHGLLGEVIMYNRNLSAEEILKVKRYLSNKWGIQI